MKTVEPYRFATSITAAPPLVHRLSSKGSLSYKINCGVMFAEHILQARLMSR